MKKVLNGLGIFGSIILTIFLVILIFLYVIVLNLKFVVSKDGMANTLKKIDVVETLKTTEDGEAWESIREFANTLNLTEEEFEKILNSDKVREEVGNFINEVLSSMLSDEKINLSKKEVENFVNTAVSEYNKVSDVKISNAEKQEIINSLDEEIIVDLNESINSLDLADTLTPEYAEYLKFTNNILFGNFSVIILLVILVVIGLLCLFRFSYYKWISYVKISTIVNTIIMVVLGLVILFVPIQEINMLTTIKKLLATNILMTAGVLFVITIFLGILERVLKKYLESKNIKQ